MTKKDYMQIAQILVDNYDESCEGFWTMVNEFGLMFKTGNSKYNHDLFVDYIKARIQ